MHSQAADNYLKLTVRTEREVRDTIIPFRTHDRASVVDALSTALGLQQHAVSFGPHKSSAISAFDASPFKRLGENVPQIGDWAECDLRTVPDAADDEPATFH